MHFTLKQLRYVDAALRTGSIVQAAREMNISQSSIAAAIDASEALMGVPLFHRMPAKGIVPTDEGLLAASKIGAFLADARILESDLLSSRGATVGSLRMGCYAPTAPYMLPRILNRLTVQHPEIRIELREGDMESLVGFLNTGVIDAALTYRRTIPETMFFQPMFRARPRCTAARSLAAGRQVRTFAHRYRRSANDHARPRRNQALLHLDLQASRPRPAHCTHDPKFLGPARPRGGQLRVLDPQHLRPQRPKRRKRLCLPPLRRSFQNISTAMGRM